MVESPSSGPIAMAGYNQDRRKDEQMRFEPAGPRFGRQNMHKSPKQSSKPPVSYSDAKPSASRLLESVTSIPKIMYEETGLPGIAIRAHGPTNKVLV